MWCIPAGHHTTRQWYSLMRKFRANWGIPDTQRRLHKCEGLKKVALILLAPDPHSIPDRRQRSGKGSRVVIVTRLNLHFLQGRRDFGLLLGPLSPLPGNIARAPRLCKCQRHFWTLRKISTSVNEGNVLFTNLNSQEMGVRENSGDQNYSEKKPMFASASAVQQIRLSFLTRSVFSTTFQEICGWHAHNHAYLMLMVETTLTKGCHFNAQRNPGGFEYPRFCYLHCVQSDLTDEACPTKN